MIENSISNIISGINSGETVVFCGSGISRDSGLPIVNEIVPYILKTLGVENKYIDRLYDSEKLIIPFEYFMQELDNISRSELIFDIYKLGEPNTNHILLAKLVGAGKLKTIITTNFDTLIEKALFNEGLNENVDYEVVYKEENFGEINWSDNKIRLVKLHGTIERKEEMAISLERVAKELYFKQKFSLLDYVFSKGSHLNVLVIGYSSSDNFDISPLISSINDETKTVYYVQHSYKFYEEELNKLESNNPFKKFYTGKRIYLDTNYIINRIWESIFSDQYILYRSNTDWQYNINKWHDEHLGRRGEVLRYALPAYMFMFTGEFEYVVQNFEKAIKVALVNQNYDWVGIWYGHIGDAYIKLGQFDDAVNCINDAIKIAHQINVRRIEIMAYFYLGNIYMSRGFTDRAFENYNKALQIGNDINDFTNHNLIIGNIGHIYMENGDEQKALELFNNALSYSRKIGDKKWEAACLSNIGRIYFFLGDNTASLDSLNYGLEISILIGDKDTMSACNQYLGEYYFCYGHYIEATNFFLNSLKISREIGFKKREAECMISIFQILRSHGNISDALMHLEGAKKIAVEIKDDGLVEIIALVEKDLNF